MHDSGARTAFWQKPALALGAGGGLLLAGHPFFAWPFWFLGIASLFLAAARFDFNRLPAWACAVSLIAALGHTSVHGNFLLNWSAFWAVALIRFVWLLLVLLLLTAGRHRFRKAWPCYAALVISGSEVLFGIFPYGFTLGSAHLFTTVPLLTQTAWLGGGSFQVFLLALVCTTVVSALTGDGEAQAAFGQLALATALILGMGIARLTGETTPPLRLAAATVRLPDTAPADPQGWLLTRYEAVARDAAAAGAVVLVLPEEQFVAHDAQALATLHAGLRELALRHRLPILAGIRRHDEQGKLYHNEAVFIGRTGTVLTNYSKAHPLPLLEHAVPGPVAGAIVPGPEAFGILICYDDILPHSFRRLVQQGARFALVPSNDWREIAGMHLRIVRHRATATGLPLLRSTSGGYLAAVDGQGRVLAKKSFFDEETTVLVADLPAGSGQSPYALAGSWIEYKEGLLAVVLILFSLLLGRPVRASGYGGTGLSARRGGMPY